MSPAPRFFHQNIIAKLMSHLGQYLREHPLGVCVPAPVDVFFTDTNTYQPDIVFVSEERRSRIQEDGVHGAPDLVVEVLSKGTRKLDEGFKKKVYAACGVTEYWITDPDPAEVQVFHLQSSVEVPDRTLGRDAELATELLPGLTIPLAEVLENPVQTSAS